jgi:hypothetical protein
MGNIHPFETFIPLAEDLAEKWKNEEGRLVAVYHVDFTYYTGSSSTPYQPNLDVINYQFISRDSGVIAEVASGDTRMGKTFYQDPEEPYRPRDQARRGITPLGLMMIILALVGLPVLALAAWWMFLRNKRRTPGAPPPLRQPPPHPPANPGAPPPPLPPDAKR